MVPLATASVTCHDQALTTSPATVERPPVLKGRKPDASGRSEDGRRECAGRPQGTVRGRRAHTVWPMCTAPAAPAISARRRGQPLRLRCSRQVYLLPTSGVTPPQAPTAEAATEPGHSRSTQGRAESAQLDLIAAEADAAPTTGPAVSEPPGAEIARWWEGEGADLVYRPSRSRAPQGGWESLVFRLSADLVHRTSGAGCCGGLYRAGPWRDRRQRRNVGRTTASHT